MADTQGEGWSDYQEGTAPPEPLDVPMNDHRRSTGPLTTSGLSNCMAIVAYHPPSGEAVLYHLNTQGLYEKDLDAEVDENSEGSDDEPDPSLRFVPARLEAAKSDVDGWLGRTDGVRYAIALGFQWSDQGSARPKRKAELVGAINELFHPTQFLTGGQSTATWDPFTEQLT